MDISQYDYFLPETQIAQHPTADRTASSLLVMGQSKGNFQNLEFRNILDLLMPDDLLVVNDTRVLPARLFGHKPTGGKVEIMLERILSDTIALVMLGANKPISICGRLRRYHRHSVGARRHVGCTTWRRLHRPYWCRYILFKCKSWFNMLRNYWQ